MPEFIIKPLIVLHGQEPDIDLVAHAVLPFGGLVAGGAARYVSGAGADIPPGDIDVFMLRGGDPVTVYSVLTALGWDTVVYQTPSVVTMENPGHLKVQVVRGGGNGFRAWASPSEVLSEFGFSTEMFAIVDGVTLQILTTQAAIDDTAARVLRVNAVIDPVRLAWRTMKYARKGFTMEPAEMAEIFRAFNSRSVAEREEWLADNIVREDETAYRLLLDSEDGPTIKAPF